MATKPPKKLTGTCGYCDNHRELCARCKYCTKCCKCTLCAECRLLKPPKHYCNSCGCCIRKICVCKRKMHGAGAILNPLKQNLYVNKLPRMLGIESELATFGSFKELPRKASYQYQITHDGSVKPSGQEVVLSPLVGDKFIKGIWQFAEDCMKAKATVNTTCGVHVHVDGRDIDSFGIRRLIQLYTVLEPVIYKALISRERYEKETKRLRYYPESRKTWNNNLVRLWNCTSEGDIKKIITEVLYSVSYPERLGNPAKPLPATVCPKCGGPKGSGATMCRTCLNMTMQIEETVKRYKGTKYGLRPDGITGSRYWGFNLHSWMYRGTVEFRMKEGTTSLTELVCWPLFCGWMVHLAAQLPDAVIRPIKTIEEFIELKLTPTSKRPAMPKYLRRWVINRIQQAKGEL